MSDVLTRWNLLPASRALNEILPCCGSQAWANEIVARRPLLDGASLLSASDDIWRSLSESDWLEAFRSHPRIGESKAVTDASPQSARDSATTALAEGNRIYERKFKRIFIVCATGKSPEEILNILRRRLETDERTELQEAAEQQRLITQIRLRKWLQP